MDTSNNGQFWPLVLETLQGHMTKAAYNAWLSTATADFDGHKLTIYAANEAGLTWLTERLQPLIRRAVSSLASDIEIEFALQSQQLALSLQFQGIYGDDYAAIVKPDIVFVGTQYFRRVWSPILGGNLTLLIIELRQRCYVNKRTGEIRNQCVATYDELAAATGIANSTTRRLLRPGPLVDEFIIDRQTLKHYDPAKGRKVNMSTLWKIRLDEPIFDPEKHCKIIGDK